MSQKQQHTLQRNILLLFFFFGITALLLYISQRGIQFSQDQRKRALEPAELPNPSRFVPITGTWSKQGVGQVGLYDRKNGKFHLGTYNPTTLLGYDAIKPFTFEKSGPAITPFMGDWDGDGQFTPGIYDDDTATFYMSNSTSTGNASLQFTFGNPRFGMVPIVGDWDGDKKTDIGLFDQFHGLFLLRTERSTGAATISFSYGQPGRKYIPFSGDWDGDGKDGVALFDVSIGRILLKNQLTSGVADIDVQTPYFLVWDTVLPFAVKKNPNDKVSYVGFYYAINNTFYFSDNKTFANAPRTTLCPQEPYTADAPHALSYFGYFGVSGTGEDGYKSYVKEIATLNNSNVAQIAPLDAEATLKRLDELSEAKMKAILSVEQFFFRRDQAGNPVLLENYQEIAKKLLKTIGSSKQHIYAFYFDEPFANRITAREFGLLTSTLRTLEPRINIMISEAPGTIMNGILPSSYLTNVSDVAFDYYINDQVEYPNATFACTQALGTAAKSLPVSKLWVIQQGYTSSESTVKSATEDLKRMYAFAQGTNKVVGLISFLYPDASFVHQLSIKEIFELRATQAVNEYKALHLSIGKSISRK